MKLSELLEILWSCPKKISGTVIKVDGEIYKNPERQFIENLDEKGYDE